MGNRKTAGFRRIGNTQFSVVAVDLFAAALSVPLAILLRLDFQFPAELLTVSLAYSLVFGLTFAAIGTSRNLYSQRFLAGSLDELRVLIESLFLVTFFFFILVQIGIFGLPRSAVLIGALLFLLFSGGARAFLRFRRIRQIRSRNGAIRAIVYGAGHAAESLVPQLLDVPDSPYVPVALLDDSPIKVARQIRGVPVVGDWDDLADAVAKHKAQAIIVAIPSASSELLSRVQQEASSRALSVVVLPALSEYLRGKTTSRDLRLLTIEDLVGRKTASLDPSPIARLIEGKRVLVTGAGGSIGSELASQICNFSPSEVFLLDRDETGLLNTSLLLDTERNFPAHKTLLADIRDSVVVKDFFCSLQPDVVFHAAALKHLAILERFPSEAWKTNVQGTINVLEASLAAGVSVFVNISTDKAADPTSVLGSSKRMSEQLTAWAGLTSKQSYVSVRFGNVLGSRGSLIPIVSDQISKGGPVTVTSKHASRFFMSISEACQLVLRAAAEGEAQDVMVLDMGDPVRVEDIVRRMIALSGKEVEVEYIGLREGEKLHEVLVSDSEILLPSGHPSILRFKSVPLDPSSISDAIWT